MIQVKATDCANGYRYCYGRASIFGKHTQEHKFKFKAAHSVLSFILRPKRSFAGHLFNLDVHRLFNVNKKWRPKGRFEPRSRRQAQLEFAEYQVGT